MLRRKLVPHILHSGTPLVPRSASSLLQLGSLNLRCWLVRSSHLRPPITIAIYPACCSGHLYRPFDSIRPNCVNAPRTFVAPVYWFCPFNSRNLTFSTRNGLHPSFGMDRTSQHLCDCHSPYLDDSHTIRIRTATLVC
jgi:hypothetical protein